MRRRYGGEGAAGEPAAADSTGRTNAADRDLASLVLNGAFGEVAVEPIGDASALTRALAARRFGLVITELELGWIGGSEVVRLVRELEPNCAVILFTRLLSAELVDEAIRLGVDAYVSPLGRVSVG